MSDQAHIFLFSYGTLQLASVQMSSFGRLLEGHDDLMPGYRQDLVEITDEEVIRKSGQTFHPIVIPSENPLDTVAGKVFAITSDELAAADQYEVSDYKRVEVRLASGKQAWVYIKAE